MDHQDFKTLGYQIIDWIADYMQSGYEGRVVPEMEPGDLLKRLPEHPSQEGEPGQDVMRDFKQLILPATTHWNDPRFFGYFPCNHSGPGILGDLLSAGLGVNAMSWNTCPAATELEIRMMQWLGEMIGLSWPGVIQDTASTGTFCALLSARERVATVNREGYYGQQPLVAYASDQAHSSVIKAARMAGIGDRYLRLIESREDFSVDCDRLERTIEADLKAGRRPFLMVATVGTTSTTAVDPVGRLSEICQRHGLWLHVDAALAGTAAILPEMAWVMDGVAQADSFLFNPHKWMFTNFDCCAYFCKQPDDLKRALAIQPEYLKSDHDAVVENFRDWNVQLGRRFRALKLWFVIRSYGVEGLRAKLRQHLAMTRWFAQQVEANPRTRLLVPPRLNTVCFRLEDDTATQALMRRVNASGEAFLTHTVVADRFVIRVAFGQTHSRFEHAEQLWALVQRCLPEKGSKE